MTFGTFSDRLFENFEVSETGLSAMIPEMIFETFWDRLFENFEVN